MDARSTLPEVLFANVRAGEILGHSQESLMTLSVADFYDHAHLEDLIRKLPVVAEKDRTFETEKELHRADGRTVLCRWTVSGTIGEDGIPQLYVLTFQPSVPKGETPTHGLPASIDAMKDRSRIEALAVLTLSMAHDFNNVLASLGINLALAQVAPGATDEVKESLSRAEASFQTAQALTMQLLTVAKGSAPERSEAHLGKMLQHAEGLAMLDPSVRCEIQVANHLWLCSVEETQILQVFHNLLVNARQAMAERGGVIQASCENRELKDGVMPELPEGNYVVVTLRDEGCGIPEEKLTKIFDTFFTTKEGGTGLGLAACRTAIERHAGAITVRSKVGVGTEFQIFLPAAEPTREPDMVFDEEVPSLVVEREETPSTSFFGDGSILVVDDQDDVRKAAVLLLEAMGYEATPAPSGEDAIQ
ncbi:MAG: ATP-binding protein, partial [Verrucomicrobiota bacterium]